MRWLMFALLLFNLGYMISNWVQFEHSNKTGDQYDPDVGDLPNSPMPGAGVILINEQPDIESNLNGNKGGSANGQVSREVAKKTDPGVNKCNLIGPLRVVEAWKPSDAIIESKLLNIDGRLIDVEIVESVDYWVYLAPETTRENALLKLKELQNKQIESYVIPEGDLINGISLGVFDKKDNAGRRLNEISQLGYGAKLFENKRKTNEIWLQIEATPERKLIEELLARMIRVNEGVKLKEETCDHVASKEEIH